MIPFLSSFSFILEVLDSERYFLVVASRRIQPSQHNIDWFNQNPRIIKFPCRIDQDICVMAYRFAIRFLLGIWDTRSRRSGTDTPVHIQSYHPHHTEAVCFFQPGHTYINCFFTSASSRPVSLATYWAIWAVRLS